MESKDILIFRIITIILSILLIINLGLLAIPIIIIMFLFSITGLG